MEEEVIPEESKKDFSKEKESGLHGWFQRQGGKGKAKGWVDCNTCRKNKKTGRKSCKACGRGEGEKRGKPPRCRPTPSQCKGYKKPSQEESKKMPNIKIKREQLMNMIHEEIEGVLEAEGEKDACYHKVKGRYKKWPSAYASGALVKCRKVGAKNWGNSSKKNEEVKEVKKEIPSDVKDIAKELDEQGYYEVDAISEDEEYCPSCSPLYQEAKPAKGKRFAKKVKGKGGRTRTVSYGQAGQKKGGGDRISPGTKKADAYCARSNKIKKCKNPPCANTLSRKKWKCQGDKSVTE
tara:strand:- start:6182 stop:7060 length:879 start_codon:yes stop_codon:yes gene_type:complete